MAQSGRLHIHTPFGQPSQDLDRNTPVEGCIGHGRVYLQVVAINALGHAPGAQCSQQADVHNRRGVKGRLRWVLTYHRWVPATDQAAVDPLWVHAVRDHQIEVPRNEVAGGGLQVEADTPMKHSHAPKIIEIPGDRRSFDIEHIALHHGLE